MTGARQTIAVVITFRESHKSSLERRACACRASIKNTLHLHQEQQVQHLGPGHFVQRLEFCKWLTDNYRLYCHKLLTDVSQLNRDGVHNRHSSRVWSDENPHATVESNFALRFIENVCYWSVHIWKSSYMRGLCQISEGEIGPTFGGCACEYARPYVLANWLRTS